MYCRFVTCDTASSRTFAPYRGDLQANPPSEENCKKRLRNEEQYGKKKSTAFKALSVPDIVAVQGSDGCIVRLVEEMVADSRRGAWKGCQAQRTVGAYVLSA